MKKLILSVAVLAAITSTLLIGQTTNPGSFRAPTVYKGTDNTKVYWTAGTIYNGGHAYTTAAGSKSLDSTMTSCVAPAYSACDILYTNSTGVVQNVTQTVATASAAGNTILALIETTNGSAVITSIALPLQSGTLWNQSVGPLLSAVTSLLPASPGGTSVGSNAYPFSGIYLGGSATTNYLISGAATPAAAKTLKLTDWGTNGAFGFGDPTDPTKTILYDLHSATASTALTIAETLAANRTITITDPGGAANFAYTNPTTAQTFTGTTYDTAGSGNTFKSNGSTVAAVAGTLGAVQTTSGTGITDGNFDPVGTPITLPAGLANATGKTLRVHVQGIFNQSATTVDNAEIALCTVSGCGSGTTWAPAGCAITTASNTNTGINAQFSFDCTLVVATTGATGTFMAKSIGCFNLGANTAIAPTCLQDTATAASTTGNLTVTEYIQPMFKFTTANGGNTATVQVFTAELLN